MAMATAWSVDVNPEEVNYFMSKLLMHIYEHFDRQLLIDVTFKLPNTSALVTAHRLILSAASPYFSELFKNNKEFCPLIEISDIDSDIFERLIAFCYTGKALITSDNVCRMLKAALSLQLADVVTSCVNFLMKHINEHTLQRVYALESELQCGILNEKIFEYEIDNFMWIIQSAEFFNFEASKLQKIIESEALNAPNEKDVFHAVKRWYEYDASARVQKLPHLVSCLRLTQFDTDFILAYIQPLPGCDIIAEEALTWINHYWARSTLSIKYIRPRKGPTANSALVRRSHLSNGTTRIHACYNDNNNNSVISEESFLALSIEGGESKTIFQYNKNKDLWHELAVIEIDNEVSEFRAIFMDDSLFFIGGLRNNKTINEVSSWNFETKTFEELPAMKHSRYLHCLVTLNDKIYAIGGWGGTHNQILQSMEAYSASKGVWRQMKGMITARYNACAVVLNGKIYVMGGYNERELNSVECYDPTMNCWTQCVDMKEVHSSPGATVHNGQIFVLGGCNQMESSPTVERCCDPQNNEWTKIRSLQNGRWGFGCISIGKQLWAVGGYTHDYTNCVSVYDERYKKWITKNPIPMAGHYYCFTAPKALIEIEEQMREM